MIDADDERGEIGSDVRPAAMRLQFLPITLHATPTET
jgi:hypothetical protein